MNILFLTDKIDYTDGVTTHLYYLIKNLNEHDVKLFIVSSGGNATDKFSSLGINIEIYEYAGFNVRSISNFLRTCRFINQYAQKNKIRILHSHNHYIANAANISSRFCKAKTIQTIHGIIPQSGILKQYVSEFYIGVNRHITDFLEDNKIASPENHALIYNGIDTATDKRHDKINVSRIIAASRLVKEKGMDTFIKAVAGLNDNLRKERNFIISGKGEYENELKNLNSNLNNPVIFTGEIKDMEREIDSAGIFVLPTAYESEGFPMTLLEAGKSGCFVISSDFPGSKYIIEDNKDGLIFKMNDPEDLKSKLEYAILNSDKCTLMADVFYQKVRNKFTASVMAEKHFEFYKRIIAN